MFSGRKGEYDSEESSEEEEVYEELDDGKEIVIIINIYIGRVRGERLDSMS